MLCPAAVSGCPEVRHRTRTPGGRSVTGWSGRHSEALIVSTRASDVGADSRRRQMFFYSRHMQYLNRKILFPRSLPYSSLSSRPFPHAFLLLPCFLPSTFSYPYKSSQRFWSSAVISVREFGQNLPKIVFQCI